MRYLAGSGSGDSKLIESAHERTANLLDGFRLGEVEVRPREERVIGPDGEQHLEPKVMAVLLHLSAHAGEPVSRESLLEEVWQDTIVGDEVLSRAVSLLRSALGDERTRPRFIRTLPRQGYELISPVTPLRQAAEPTLRWPLALAGTVLLALAALALWYSPDGGVETTTIAVIPFDVSGLGGEDRPAADGLADHLISALTQQPQLGVISRRASFALRDSTMDVRAIGSMLDADYLVEGALTREQAALALTLSIVDADTGRSLWTQRIRKPGPIGNLQRAALNALSAGLGDTLGVAPLAEQTPVRSADAYERYLEARYQWSLRGERRIRRAISLLEEAIAIDPAFARGHLALAQSLAVRPFYTDVDVPESFRQARAQAAEALRLDAALAPELDALEGFMLMREKSWEAASAHLERSLAADPGNPLAHYWYSMLLSQFGRHALALEHIETSARLDPLSAVINDRLALAYLWKDQDAAAARQYAVAASLGFLESTQVKPYVLLAAREGRFEDIRASLLRLGNEPAWVEAFVKGLEDPAARAQAAQVIDAARVRGEVDRSYWFGIWVLLGDADRAFRDFDGGFRTQDIELLWARESRFLREDPRFAATLASVRLDHLAP